MGGTVHEVIGVAVAAIVAVTIVSALAPKAQTKGVIDASFSGFNGLLGAISKPVS